MENLRGKVTRISFSVEYPDGSKKESHYEPKTELKAVLLSEEFMTDEMKKLFTRSKSNWKDNPAMIIVDGDTMVASCDFPDCRPA